jgi:hypothetical protein
MDYKKYYESQAGSGMTVFRGNPYQRGHGLGGIFKTLFNYIMPIFKTHALPVLKRGAKIVGTEAIKTASNIANDAIKGRNIREASREHLEEAVDSLSAQALSNLQTGSGISKTKYKKRKINNNYIFKKPFYAKRRVRDIFDFQKK